MPIPLSFKENLLEYISRSFTFPKFSFNPYVGDFWTCYLNPLRTMVDFVGGQNDFWLVSKFIVKLYLPMKKCQFQPKSGQLVLNGLTYDSIPRRELIEVSWMVINGLNFKRRGRQFLAFGWLCGGEQGEWKHFFHPFFCFLTFHGELWRVP